MCFSGCSWTKSHTQTQNSKKLCLQGKAELAWECVFSALSSVWFAPAKFTEMGFTSRSPPLPVLMKHLYCLWVECLSWFWTKNSGITVFLYKSELCGKQKGKIPLTTDFCVISLSTHTDIRRVVFSGCIFQSWNQERKKLFRNQKQSEHLVGKLIKLCF